MSESVYRISLDLHETNSQACLNVKRTDSYRVIIATLMENGKPYHIEDGCSAYFTAKKPDGRVIYNDCIISDDTIMYELTEQTTAVPGITECEFVLYDITGRKNTSPRFTILVDTTVYNGEEIVSSDEAKFVESFIEKTREVEYKLEHGEFKGEKGDPGEKGDSGVYVGSGEMPEGYNVQIDPEGDTSEEYIKSIIREFTNDSDFSAEVKDNTLVFNTSSNVQVAEGVLSL